MCVGDYKLMCVRIYRLKNLPYNVLLVEKNNLYGRRNL